MLRLMRLFDKYKVRSTFCIPGHTIDTWPDLCREIAAAGHETGHHAFVVHPQSIGRAHMITRLEELIVHMKARGAWFATLSEIADATERAV